MGLPIAKVVGTFVIGRGDVAKQHEVKIQEFQGMIRQAALFKMQDQSGVEDIVAVDHLNRRSSILGHWLTLVMISGRKVKICFKVHFNTENGRELLAVGSKIERSKIERRMIFDRLKEFCNLAGGAIKQCLGVENDRSGLSLPLLARGFDEVLFMDRALRANALKYRDVWVLAAPSFKVTCSSEIQIVDWTVLKDIQPIARKRENEGELEFL